VKKLVSKIIVKSNPEFFANQNKNPDQKKKKDNRYVFHGV